MSLLLGLSCAWLCTPARIHAQAEAPPAEAASSEYEDAILRAVEEFDAGHWEEARALFRRAHEISSNARTWRGLGITAFELRRYVDAVSELEAALTSTIKPLTDKQREELRELQERARAFVSIYTIVLTPPNATLEVDGQPGQLRAGQLLLDPGTHALLVRAEGHQDWRAELRAEAGQHEQISIELQPERQPDAPAALAPSPRTPARPARESPAPARHVVTWSLAGAALGVAVTAAVVGKFARDKNQAYRKLGCDPSDQATSDSACPSLLDEGQRQQRATNALIGVAGTLAISAVVAYFLESRARRPLRAALWPELRGAGLVSALEF